MGIPAKLSVFTGKHFLKDVVLIKKTFASIHRRLRETGSFSVVHADLGAQRTVRTADLEEQILDMIEADPGTSTRKIAEELQLSHVTVWKVLRQELLFPYHIQRVQALLETDFEPRRAFCEWFIQQCIDPQFQSKILFTDEAQFTRNGVMNFHNNHQWAQENPHAINHTRHQQQFSCNVWAGIVGDCLIGPFFLPPILNGQTYRNFLEEELPALLEDVPLHVRHQSWFMHDGAPAHFSLIAREFLDATYHERWIGRGGSVRWPARSPDCNPLDFYLWGHLKDLVYRAPIPTVQVLRERIEHSFQIIRNTPGIFERVRQSMIRRCGACIEARGGHFEHLI